MSRAVEAAALSLGYALDTGPAACGVVHSVFRHAANFMVRGEMWTLLAEAKSDLPLGIRVAVPDFAALGIRCGEPVHVRAGFVGIASRFIVDCRAAARWMPTPAGAPAPGLLPRLAVVAKAVRGKSWSGSGEMAQAVKSAAHSATGLGDVLAKVVGCGPGATPSGDDVLVGILAVLTLRPSGATAAELLRRALLPLLPTTTEVSAHLLRQAAHGHFNRAVHELVCAVVGNPSLEELSGAVRRVVETGATSGADTCEGLLAFAPNYFILQHEMIAA